MLKKIIPWRGFLKLKFALILIAATLLPAALTANAASRHDGIQGWTTYLGTSSRDGYAGSEYLLNPSNVVNLGVRWSVTAAASVSDEPIVADGVVYWGSWDGIEHATTIYGHQLWTASLGITHTGHQCFPDKVGIAGSAAVADTVIAGESQPVVFVPGGNAQLYALNAESGATIWHVSMGAVGSDFLWGSPLVYRGNVYLGVASFGDCPLVQGKLVELNAATGTIENTFDTVPNGCVGVGLWATPALDTATGMIYDVSGNGGSCSLSRAPGRGHDRAERLEPLACRVLGDSTEPERCRFRFRSDAHPV